MKNAKLLFIFLIAAILSCSSGLRREEVPIWLKSICNDDKVSINLNGRWYDAEYDFKEAKVSLFGWGAGFFNQKNDKISGTLGNYDMQGRICNDTVYGVFLYGGSVYYTFKMKLQEKDLLLGNYFSPNDKTQQNGYAMSLKKLSGSPESFQVK